MRRLRLATVGTGYFSRFHYGAWRRMPDIEIVGVCALDLAEAEAKAAEFPAASAFNDFETMLDTVKPDLVDIITPPATHLRFAKAVAARGIPAICQKAFCQNLAEAEQAVAAVRAAGSLLVIHENFRFQPWHRKAREIIGSGILGELFGLTFWLRPGDGQGPRAYLDRQPYFQQMPRFLVRETAIHHVDLFRFLFGEVAAVFADLRRLNPAIAGEDAGLILFEFENGRRGVFDGNRLADHIADNRRLTMGEMRIEGAAGTLRLDGFGRLFLRKHGENAEADVAFAWNDTGFGGDCVFALQRHVLDHLINGAPLENRAGEYLTNLRIEEAIYASAETGERRTV